MSELCLGCFLEDKIKDENLCKDCLLEVWQEQKTFVSENEVKREWKVNQQLKIIEEEVNSSTQLIGDFTENTYLEHRELDEAVDNLNEAIRIIKYYKEAYGSDLAKTFLEKIEEN